MSLKEPNERLVAERRQHKTNTCYHTHPDCSSRAQVDKLRPATDEEIDRYRMRECMECHNKRMREVLD